MSIFAYDSNDPELILSCCLDDINLDDVSSEVIFPLNSKWKDRSLLYSTVQAYAALTGWKPTLSHTYCIKCSCYNRPIRGGKDRNFLLDHYEKDVNGQLTSSPPCMIPYQ